MENCISSMLGQCADKEQYLEDFRNLPAELQSQVFLEVWRRPSIHFFQIGIQDTVWAFNLELIDATGSSDMLLGNLDPACSFGGLALAPPRLLGSDSTLITKTGWFTGENESGYARTAQLRTINTQSRDDIDRVTRLEPGWVSMNIPEGSFHRLAFNPEQDVFAIQGLECLQLLPMEKNMVLHHSFPEVLKEVRQLCFEIEPEASTQDRSTTPADIAVGFADKDNWDVDLWFLGMHCPRLQTVYILDRSLKLKEGKEVPEHAKRFFGNGCTFVELPNTWESSVLEADEDGASVWDHGDCRTVTFAHELTLAQRRLYMCLSGPYGIPPADLGLDFIPQSGWEAEEQDAAEAMFRVCVLARVEGYV